MEEVETRGGERDYPMIPDLECREGWQRAPLDNKTGKGRKVM